MAPPSPQAAGKKIGSGIKFALGLVGAIVIAWLMWKYVEEPAREWMRRRSGERPKPVEEIALENG